MGRFFLSPEKRFFSCFFPRAGEWSPFSQNDELPFPDGGKALPPFPSKIADSTAPPNEEKVRIPPPRRLLITPFSLYKIAKLLSFHQPS